MSEQSEQPCTAFACPKCEQRRSKVVSMSREKHWNRRRRECINCGERWTTYERAMYYSAQRV